MITRLWFRLIHLNEHRFSNNFNDCINPLCTCSLDFESTVHYFLHCNYYNSARILLNGLNSVDKTLLNPSDLFLVNVLLCGVPQFDDFQNVFILNSSIEYILISERLLLVSFFSLQFSVLFNMILSMFKFQLIYYLPIRLNWKGYWYYSNYFSTLFIFSLNFYSLFLPFFYKV